MATTTGQNYKLGPYEINYFFMSEIRKLTESMNSQWNNYPLLTFHFLFVWIGNRKLTDHSGHCLAIEIPIKNAVSPCTNFLYD